MTTKKPTTKEPVTALAVATAATRELTPGIWAMIEKMAPAMFKSRLFGVTSIEQAEAIMLKGFELGLSMTASFELVQVIQGKPALSPRGAMALLLSSPVMKDIEIKRLEGQKGFIGYECTMTRASGFTHTSKFTMDDAAKADLVKANSGWMKYPENMCLWRAIGFAADVVAPDVVAGMTSIMKAPEMYGVALTEGGDVVDAPTFDSALSDLEKEFGAEKIYNVYRTIPQTFEQIAEVRKALAANDGQIPSNGQVEEVRAKLEAEASK